MPIRTIAAIVLCVAVTSLAPSQLRSQVVRPSVAQVGKDRITSGIVLEPTQLRRLASIDQTFAQQFEALLRSSASPRSVEFRQRLQDLLRNRHREFFGMLSVAQKSIWVRNVDEVSRERGHLAVSEYRFP